MGNSTRWSWKQQVDWFRTQFAQHASLPFSEVLPAKVVGDGLLSLGVRFYDSLYNPVTVLWLLLGQVILANPTSTVTVENFLAGRLGQGMAPCSTDTGGYARARKWLPEALLARWNKRPGGMEVGLPRVRHQPPPDERPTRQRMVRMIAQLGGYVNRIPSDEPGPQTVWLGLQRAHDIALCWNTFGPDAKLPKIPEPKPPAILV